MSKKTKSVILDIVIVVLVILVGSNVYASYQHSKNPDQIVMPLGFATLNVLSGSMEPEYMIGDNILVIRTDPQKLEPGDIITFYNEDHAVVTHRIVALAEAENGPGFITKGDNNNIEDSFIVPHDNVIGKAIANLVPLNMLSNGRQMLYIVWGIVVLVIAGLLIKEIRKDKKKQGESPTHTDK